MMWEKDQEARFRLFPINGLRQMESEEIKGLIDAVDQENLPRLKQIVDQFGYPGIRLVGEEGAEKMWLLVQHSDRDLEFQKLCLDLL